MRIASFTLMMSILASAISFAAADSFRESPNKYWNFKELEKAPAYKAATFLDSKFPGLQAILYDGVEVDGVKSPVFAYIGYAFLQIHKRNSVAGINGSYAQVFQSVE